MLPKDLKNNCFGPYLAYIWVLEYQKQGLPHAHIVLWLKNEDFFLMPDNIDKIIPAHISDADEDPKLIQTMKNMVHGP